MTADSRSGRPRASSREVLAEAACELFLEKGYDATSIADIAQRAGVSRSSFFNYFGSKGDVLWAGFDERLAAFERRLAADRADDATGEAVDDVHAATTAIGADFAPDSLALALVNSAAMGLGEELEREASVRRSRISRVVAERLRRGGMDRLRSDVAGSAVGGAVLAALEAWARSGAGTTELAPLLRDALDAASAPFRVRASVRQLRVVVQAPDFDEALAFYRDVVGLPQAEAYEAAGGARVAILDAGRATLELANPAQVAFIDAVETDGGASDRIRIALEVDDTAAALARLAAAGAVVEAAPRTTPWRSVNARLRAPADLQLTVFQELYPS